MFSFKSLIFIFVIEEVFSFFDPEVVNRLVTHHIQLSKRNNILIFVQPHLCFSFFKLNLGPVLENKKLIFTSLAHPQGGQLNIFFWLVCTTYVISCIAIFLYLPSFRNDRVPSLTSYSLLTNRVSRDPFIL
jgi:hypothetical protein